MKKISSSCHNITGLANFNLMTICKYHNNRLVRHEHFLVMASQSFVSHGAGVCVSLSGKKHPRRTKAMRKLAPAS